MFENTTILFFIVIFIAIIVMVMYVKNDSDTSYVDKYIDVFKPDDPTESTDE